MRPLVLQQKWIESWGLDKDYFYAGMWYAMSDKTTYGIQYVQQQPIIIGMAKLPEEIMAELNKKGLPRIFTAHVLDINEKHFVEMLYQRPEWAEYDFGSPHSPAQYVVLFHKGYAIPVSACVWESLENLLRQGEIKMAEMNLKLLFKSIKEVS